MALSSNALSSNFNYRQNRKRVIPTKTPTQVPLPTSAPVYQWGAYTGWSATQAREFETKVGHEMNLVASFVHWGNEKEFPTDLANFAKNGGKTLVIYWEAMDYNNPSVDNNPLYSYNSILAGKWDSYFVSFAQSAKTYGSPVILIPFEEANGDWYPWSATKNNNTVAKYISAFQYLRGFFKDAPNVKFAWDVNNDSVPDTSENSITAYYPGDIYVDYVGVNGFNFNTPWLTFDQVFRKGLTTLNNYNKPLYIFSMACAQGTGKAAWMTDAFGSQMPKYSNLKGWIWFNENKEKDWRVWSDANSLSTFTKYIQ